MTLPDLDSLRCFAAAVHHQNFRAAASAVALSPSAFGARIRQLEELVGAALFERSTRRVRLTPAGERLAPHARAAIEAATRCVDAVRGGGAPAPWSLWIGTRFELGLSWLVPALDALRESRPERTLHVYFGTDGELLRQVEAGRLDAMISSVRLAGELRYVLLHEEEYVLVGARPLLGRDAVQRETLVDAGPGMPLFRYFLDALPPEEDWRVPRSEWLGTIAAIRQRVLAGAGVAVLPRYFVTADLAERRLVELLPEVRPRTDHFRLVWKPGHPRDADLLALAEALRARPLCADAAR